MAAVMVDHTHELAPYVEPATPQTKPWVFWRRRLVAVGLGVLALTIVAPRFRAALGGAPASAPEGGPVPISYVVEPGDSLWSIARRVQPVGDPTGARGPARGRRRRRRGPARAGAHPQQLNGLSGSTAVATVVDMHCPSCGFDDTRVIDSRATDEGTSIRRRRECARCRYRFTTYRAHRRSAARGRQAIR